VKREAHAGPLACIGLASSRNAAWPWTRRRRPSAEDGRRQRFPGRVGCARERGEVSQTNQGGLAGILRGQSIAWIGARLGPPPPFWQVEWQRQAGRVEAGRWPVRQAGATVRGAVVGQDMPMGQAGLVLASWAGGLAGWRAGGGLPCPRSAG
jgi:hypothetical protein